MMRPLTYHMYVPVYRISSDPAGLLPSSSAATRLLCQKLKDYLFVLHHTAVVLPSGGYKVLRSVCI